MTATPVNVLVLAPGAQRYGAHLHSCFPQVTLASLQAPEDVGPRWGDVDVLITMGHGVTRDTIRQMPHLAWVQSLTTGVDSLIDALVGRTDVLLTSLRGIHGPQMAEMAVLHMLCLNRPVRQMLRNQDQRIWKRLDQCVLDGKSVGIVGIGVVGEAVAKICKALGMTVYGISRTPRPIEGIDRFFSRSELEEVAADVDFLVLTVPLKPDTERLIDARVLAAMKPTAFLINLARGRVVDEPALIDALRARAIAGAGLDVTDEVPLPPESPLWKMPNVVITPWVAGFSDRYAEQALTIVEPNLRHYLADELDRLTNVVER